MHLARLVLVPAVAAAAVVTLAVSPAGAAAKPTASLAVSHATIATGTAPAFSYSTKHAPKGTTLYLQRQFGSKHVWKNVRKLTHASGKVTAPKLTSLGRYYYRVHGVRKGKAVVSSSAHAVYAYGNVSLGRLCAVYNGYTCNSGDDDGTVEVGSTIFNYQVLFGDNTYPSYAHELRFASTSCRTLSLRYATDGNGQRDSTEVSYVRVVQASADPVSSHVASGHIGSLKANLDGGAFYLDTSTKDGWSIDMTGVASCWSSSGKR